MKLASGPARIGDLRAAGVAVGLGSDGEKENNNLDLLEEMKFASLLQKVSTLDPTIGDPWDILAMATIDGARALGLDEVTGSLEAGKRADVVTVDLGGLHTTPRAARAPTSTWPPTSCSRRRATTSATCGSTAAASSPAGAPTFDVASVQSRGPGRRRGALRPPGPVLAAAGRLATPSDPPSPPPPPPSPPLLPLPPPRSGGWNLPHPPPPPPPPEPSARSALTARRPGAGQARRTPPGRGGGRRRAAAGGSAPRAGGSTRCARPGGPGRRRRPRPGGRAWR